MIPGIRGITALQHTAERAIGGGIALIHAVCIFAVDPGVNDDAALAVIAKEQPILLEEFRPEPVLVLIAERCALSILGAGRGLRYDLEGELYDGGQPLRGVLSGVPLRILRAQAFDLCDQRVKGIEKLRMRQNGPALDDQGRVGRGARHSSSGRSGVFKSTLTPFTSDRARRTRAGLMPRI